MTGRFQPLVRCPGRDGEGNCDSLIDPDARKLCVNCAQVAGVSPWISPSEQQHKPVKRQAGRP